ncbi:patatin-like phospholipase family protein [Arhodomonas sp. AD133]|uniref:patatin-like phospholipase family protein n=1 Tax=Arhodomonas sp. AD133 TaxID=3415009 RepID=UPI003EC0542F
MRGSNIGLALQGGGSYAAFTSGVLKALFDGRRNFLDPARLHSISGTSGGALNALLLALSLHEGRRKPTAYVDRFWRLNRMEALLKQRYQALHMVPESVIADLIGMSRNLMSTHHRMSGSLGAEASFKSRAMDIVDDLVHFAAPNLTEDVDAAPLPTRRPFVTVAATEARTGVAHFFTSNERMIRKFEGFEIAAHRHVIRSLRLRSVYASMAHPMLFDPVHIDDGVYWDGYYTSNPPFVFLFREGCDEVVLVRLIQQVRDELGESVAETRDRIEEIVQNTTVNMEIMAYLAMRELLLTSGNGAEGVDLRLGLQRLRSATVYHEIRLLKPGNIADQGYPLAPFVAKLIDLGRKAVTDEADGFMAAYARVAPGEQVISEIDFDNATVSSRVIDIDHMLFDA